MHIPFSFIPWCSENIQYKNYICVLHQPKYALLTAVTKFFSFLWRVVKPSDNSKRVVVPEWDPQAISRPCSCTLRLCRGSSQTYRSYSNKTKIKQHRYNVGRFLIKCEKNNFHLTSREAPLAEILKFSFFFWQLWSICNLNKFIAFTIL